MIETQRRRPFLALTGRVMGAAMAAQLIAGVAWASEGAPTGNPWLGLLWKTVNFVVLVWILWYFGRKPVKALLGNAAVQSQVEMDEQRQFAQEAQDDLTQQRKRIENLEAELQRMLAETREETRAEQARLVAEARDQAERIKAGVQQQMEQEFAKARKDLQAELADQTVRLAETIVRQRMDDTSRERLTSRAIDQLGSGT